MEIDRTHSHMLHVELRPESGASIGPLIRDALITAIEYQANVSFVNPADRRRWLVKYSELVNAVRPCE